MKNFLSICLLLLIAAFSSCSTSKETRGLKSSIDGNWQLKSIITEGITGTVKSTLFNEEDFNCFVGSSWTFSKYNSLGLYVIDKNQGECIAVKRDIRWSIYEAKDEPKLFQFKRLDNKMKEMDSGAGFRFTIVKLDKSTMQLRNDISFEGKPAAFIFNFVRL
jgi:hypothetical protein